MSFPEMWMLMVHDGYGWVPAVASEYREKVFFSTTGDWSVELETQFMVMYRKEHGPNQRFRMVKFDPVESDPAWTSGPHEAAKMWGKS